MGKSTISMAMFNSYVSHYQRVSKLPSNLVLICGFDPVPMWRSGWFSRNHGPRSRAGLSQNSEPQICHVFSSLSFICCLINPHLISGTSAFYRSLTQRNGPRNWMKLGETSQCFSCLSISSLKKMTFDHLPLDPRLAHLVHTRNLVKTASAEQKLVVWKTKKKNVVAMVSWTVVESGGVTEDFFSSFFVLEKQLDFEATKRNKNKI